MKLNYLHARNGFLIEDEQGDRLVHLESNDEPIEAFRAFLWEVIDLWGPCTSRYADKRLRVIVIPGDKWVGRLDPKLRSELKSLHEEIGHILNVEDHPVSDQEQ